MASAAQSAYDAIAGSIPGDIPPLSNSQSGQSTSTPNSSSTPAPFKLGVTDYVDSSTGESVKVDGVAPELLNYADPGGVLIDQAATNVNQDLKDIAGATFDPTTQQLVFLGDNNPASVEDINLSYFYTAIQAVYGSAVPPYVTIDPTATLTAPSFDLGNGPGVIAPGQTAEV